MSDPLDQLILRIAAREGERGISMGALVDEVMDVGHGEESVELTVWSLLGEKRLVPSGFVCRMVKKRDTNKVAYQQRTYEFMLAVPSGADAQLELLESP